MYTIVAYDEQDIMEQLDLLAATSIKYIHILVASGCKNLMRP